MFPHHFYSYYPLFLSFFAIYRKYYFLYTFIYILFSHVFRRRSPPPIRLRTNKPRTPQYNAPSQPHRKAKFQTPPEPPPPSSPLRSRQSFYPSLSPVPLRQLPTTNQPHTQAIRSRPPLVPEQSPSKSKLHQRQPEVQKPPPQQQSPPLQSATPPSIRSPAFLFVFVPCA